MKSTHYETKTEGTRATQGQQPSATAETNENFAFPTTGLPPSTATNGGSTFSFQPRTTGGGAAMSNGFSAPRDFQIGDFAFGTTSVAPRRGGLSFGEPMRRSTTGFQRAGSNIVTSSGPPAANHTSFHQVSSSSGSNSFGNSSPNYGNDSFDNDRSTFGTVPERFSFSRTHAKCNGISSTCEHW